MKNTALIVVDVQNDFVEGGSLAVEGGKRIAARIADYIDTHFGVYDTIVYTQDWHIDPGTHFSETPDFIDSWPVHCVAGTTGASLEEHIASVSHRHLGKSFRLHKGEHEAAYSAFDGQMTEGERNGMPLSEFLRSRGVTSVDVVGIATDYCVKETAVKAVENGFSTRVLTDLCVGISPEGIAATTEQVFPALNIVVASASDVPWTRDGLKESLHRRVPTNDIISGTALAFAHDILIQVADRGILQPTATPNHRGGVWLKGFSGHLFWEADVQVNGVAEVTVTNMDKNTIVTTTCLTAVAVTNAIEEEGNN